MSDSFDQAFESLLEFIRTHPEIEIRESVTSVPENLRLEFYRRFNETRNMFVEQNFPGLLEKAGLLQQKFAEAERNLAGLVSWEDTPETNRIQRFLGNPVDSMVRELFDPLFELLKGKVSFREFERSGIERISAVWPGLFRAGYEKWLILSLVKYLEPEELLRAEARALKQGERTKSSAYAPWEDIPAAQPSATFMFAQPRNSILCVPDLILRSARLNRHVGIRSEFRDGLYKGLNPSQEREWLFMDPDLLHLMDAGLTLIYIAEDPQDISMIADVTIFCKPDMVLLCVDPPYSDQAHILDTLLSIEQRIAPKLGTLAVLTAPWPEIKSAGPFLNIGFESSRLQAIVNALSNPKSVVATRQFS